MTKFRKIKKSIVASVPMPFYCRVVNRLNQIRSRDYKIFPAQGEVPEIYKVLDGQSEIFICRRSRHRRYKLGVMAWIDRLASDYSLDLIDEIRDGLFIDCGANVGEVGFWARRRGFRYIAFEPEEHESRCVDLNHFNGQKTCIRKALWKENTTLRFFNRPETADSSVLPDLDGASSINIEAVTFDTAIDLSSVSGPVVFKVEAEGAEPEVLEGAIGSLHRIDWIAIDCGFERGPEKAHTLVETNVFLNDHGFRLVSAKFPRMTALYKRCR